MPVLTLYIKCTDGDVSLIGLICESSVAYMKQRLLFIFSHQHKNICRHIKKRTVYPLNDFGNLISFMTFPSYAEAVLECICTSCKWGGPRFINTFKTLFLESCHSKTCLIIPSLSYLLKCLQMSTVYFIRSLDAHDLLLLVGFIIICFNVSFLSFGLPFLLNYISSLWLAYLPWLHLIGLVVS